MVTLAIIGVVASVTLPVLINNIQQAQYHTAFKKDYSILSQAFNLLKEDHGGTLRNLYPTCGLDYCSNNNLGNDLKKYLSYVKQCGQDYVISNGCLYDTGIKYLNNSGTMPEYRFGGAFLLNDGAIFTYSLHNDEQDCDDFSINACGGYGINVDVNGFKGPNILGKDVYSIYITANGLLPFGVQGSNTENALCELNSTAETNFGWSCARKVLTNTDY